MISGHASAKAASHRRIITSSNYSLSDSSQIRTRLTGQRGDVGTLCIRRLREALANKLKLAIPLNFSRSFPLL